MDGHTDRLNEQTTDSRDSDEDTYKRTDPSFLSSCLKLSVKKWDIRRDGHTDRLNQQTTDNRDLDIREEMEREE